MKKFLILFAIMVLMSSCMTRQQLELIKIQQQLIDQYETVLDTVYRDQSDYYLDTLIDTNAYYDYVVLYNKYKALKIKSTIMKDKK